MPVPQRDALGIGDALAATHRVVADVVVARHADQLGADRRMLGQAVRELVLGLFADEVQVAGGEQEIEALVADGLRDAREVAGEERPGGRQVSVAHLGDPDGHRLSPCWSRGCDGGRRTTLADWRAPRHAPSRRRLDTAGISGTAGARRREGLTPYARQPLE